MIESLSVGPMDNNAYLITDPDTGARLLVDAAAEPERLLAWLGEGDQGDPPRTDGPGALAGVVTTHRHADHLGGLAELLAATGATSWAGEADADAIADAAGVPLPRPLRHGDRLPVGALSLEVIALRGHTPGSIALAWTGPHEGPVHLITGDSLFPGGPGRTAGPDDFRSLMTDLEQRVFDRYDDDTVVHPGHGLPTTLGAERPALPDWWARGW